MWDNFSIILAQTSEIYETAISVKRPRSYLLISIVLGETTLWERIEERMVER